MENSPQAWVSVCTERSSNGVPTKDTKPWTTCCSTRSRSTVDSVRSQVAKALEQQSARASAAAEAEASFAAAPSSGLVDDLTAPAPPHEKQGILDMGAEEDAMEVCQSQLDDIDEGKSALLDTMKGGLTQAAKRKATNNKEKAKNSSSSSKRAKNSSVVIASLERASGQPDAESVAGLAFASGRVDAAA